MEWQQPTAEELWDHINSVNKPLAGYEQATEYIQKLKILRDYYRHNERQILQSGNRYFCNYPVDWMSLFTPIEMDAWIAIRGKGRIIMYPQYPVLNYFVDFGNPIKKIALELDGKAYHNTEKDTIRDRELKKEGWIVYRITGTEMSRTNFKDFRDCRDLDLDEDETYTEIKNWIMNTGDGVIEALSAVHFTRGEYYESSYFQGLCAESLHKHQLID